MAIVEARIRLSPTDTAVAIRNTRSTHSCSALTSRSISPVALAMATTATGSPFCRTGVAAENTVRSFTSLAAVCVPSLSVADTSPCT